MRQFHRNNILYPNHPYSRIQWTLNGRYLDGNWISRCYDVGVMDNSTRNFRIVYLNGFSNLDDF